MVTINNRLIHLHDSPAHAGTFLSSRWWTWAGVSWWTGCRTTSRVRSSTTSWTSTCTRTPSTCAGTERATTTLRAASEETQNSLPEGNRCCRLHNPPFMNCKARVSWKNPITSLSQGAGSGVLSCNIMNAWVMTFIPLNPLHLQFYCLCQLNMNLMKQRWKKLKKVSAPFSHITVRPRPAKFHRGAQTVRFEGVDEPAEENHPDRRGARGSLRTMEDTQRDWRCQYNCHLTSHIFLTDSWSSGSERQKLYCSETL